MYSKRIQIANYGPITQLDIMLPVDDAGPKPVVLVGRNGSGKSLLLSHIVNSLVAAQQSAFPLSSEVEVGRVYKLRSPRYIAPGKEFSFARVDFADTLWSGELQLMKRKQHYDGAPPDGIRGTDAAGLWDRMGNTDVSHFHSEGSNDTFRLQQLFGDNCVIYFPPDRFEDPAWLNEANLNARAVHAESMRIEGSTDRRVLNYSPLLDNQNWLFGLVYDFSVFERQSVVLPVVLNRESGRTANLPALIDTPGQARRLYDIVLSIVRAVVGREDTVRLGIGSRHDRVISVMSGDQTLAPNIFQLSSGEVSLLNLFLSILRDYDLTGNQFTHAKDIRGIVVVDEIDLHLHAHHQYVVLPKLMKMFSKVQFIVTSHSPLFVLGLQEVFGEDGFGLYHLPKGLPINPEEFSEFGDAYRAFTNTRRHTDETRSAIIKAQKVLTFVDGATDVQYHRRAAELLGFDSLLSEMEFRDGGGKLKNIWTGLTKDHAERKKVIILHDPEETVTSDTRANLYRRRIEKIRDHPLQKGVENLFSRVTLQKAIKCKPAFIDITDAHQGRKRGATVEVSETWVVNRDEKRNLCNWLCENGTHEDFQHFRPVLDVIRRIVEDHTAYQKDEVSD